MEKSYSSRTYRILLNIIYGICAAIFLGGIGEYFLDNTLYGIIIGVVVFIGYVWLVIIDNILTITVSETHICIKKGRKEDFYEINKCGFSAKTVTSSGDTECSLQITDPEGVDHYIDCELIGIGQFSELMEDLGITGSKSAVHKIATKKEE